MTLFNEINKGNKRSIFNNFFDNYIDERSKVKLFKKDICNFCKNIIPLNMKYCICNKEADYNVTILNSYNYNNELLNKFKECQETNKKVIWSTEPSIKWISWFKDDELGYSGISSKLFNTKEINDLYNRDIRLYNLLPISNKYEWNNIKDKWYIFGLGYGGDPKPITIGDKKYINAPPPKKLLYSTLKDISLKDTNYEKILNYDCYGIWLDYGVDNDHLKLYGIFDSNKGIVIRSLQLYIDPSKIIGKICFDIDYWEEIPIEYIENPNIILRSFINLIKYMNNEDEIDDVKHNINYTSPIIAKWIDGNYYHAQIINKQQNIYHINYIGYDGTYNVDEGDIINMNNSKYVPFNNNIFIVYYK